MIKGGLTTGQWAATCLALPPTARGLSGVLSLLLADFVLRV